MIIKILNNTTPYGKIMASHEGSLHSSTLTRFININTATCTLHFNLFANKHTCVCLYPPIDI